jgi:glycosyltransferase involved in cell wall biosynthesis
VPTSCGVVSNDVQVLRNAVARLHADREWAEDLGQAARLHALDRFSLDRFLAEWDQLLEMTCH